MGRRRAKAMSEGACICPITPDRRITRPCACHGSTMARSAATEHAPEWIDLVPAGSFSTRDGRGPFKNDHPDAVIAATRELRMTAGLPIDYEHATDVAAPEGRPAPAAGWIKELRIVRGGIQGRVEWTQEGARKVASREYRYVSPVFEHDQGGNVLCLLRAAVTNNPNLYMTAISSARSDQMTSQLTAVEKQVCAQTGVSEAEFAATKATRNGTTRTGLFSAGAPAPLGVCENIAHQLTEYAVTRSTGNLRAAHAYMTNFIGHAAARFLTAADLEFCKQQDLNFAKFAIAKHARMSGKPLTFSHAKAAGLSDNNPEDPAEPSELLKMAADEIAAFLKDPNNIESLQHLSNAEGYIHAAMRKAGAVRRSYAGE